MNITVANKMANDRGDVMGLDSFDGDRRFGFGENQFAKGDKFTLPASYAGLVNKQKMPSYVNDSGEEITPTAQYIFVEITNDEKPERNGMTIPLYPSMFGKSRRVYENTTPPKPTNEFISASGSAVAKFNSGGKTVAECMAAIAGQTILVKQLIPVVTTRFRQTVLQTTTVPVLDLV